MIIFVFCLHLFQVVCTDSGVAGYTTKTVNVAIKSLLADSIGERMLRRESGLAEDTGKKEVWTVFCKICMQWGVTECAIVCSPASAQALCTLMQCLEDEI